MTGADLIVLLKKNPIGAAGFLVALLCGVAFYLRGESLDAGKLTIDEITKQRDQMLANVRNSAGLSQQTEAMQTATKLLESRLVNENQRAANLQYFYRLESDTGIKLIDSRQNTVGRASGTLFIGIPYTVTFQGTFSQVLDFLQRVESGKHFSKFSSISFNKAAGSDAAGALLSVSMNIELLGTP